MNGFLTVRWLFHLLLLICLSRWENPRTQLELGISVLNVCLISEDKGEEFRYTFPESSSACACNDAYGARCVAHCTNNVQVRSQLICNAESCLSPCFQIVQAGGWGANLGSFWFLFNFSQLQRLTPLGYHALFVSVHVQLTKVRLSQSLNEKTSSYLHLVPDFVNLVASVEVKRMLSMNLPKSNLPALLWWMRVSAKSVSDPKESRPRQTFQSKYNVSGLAAGDGGRKRKLRGPMSGRKSSCWSVSVNDCLSPYQSKYAYLSL